MAPMMYGWAERKLFDAYLTHRLRMHQAALLSLVVQENEKIRHFEAQCDGQVLRVNKPKRPGGLWRAKRDT